MSSGFDPRICLFRNGARVFFAVVVLIFCGKVGVKGQLIRVPLEQRMANSALVVEGEVVGSRSFYGDNGRIYTSHDVRVDKVIKGDVVGQRVEVILEGGQVGNRFLVVSHLLELHLGARGILFLNPLGKSHPCKAGSERLAYDVYASMQGFISYSGQLGRTVAADPFRLYGSIENELYPLLGLGDGVAPVLHREVGVRVGGGPVIDSIRPTAVTAGTRTTLWIHGHGFLAERGTVYFPNANLGGGSNLMIGDSTDVQEWSDSLIRIWVPSSGPLPGLTGTAGTGRVIVENWDGDSTRSLDTVHVHYGILNGRSTDSVVNAGISRFVSLFDLDTEVRTDTGGGYTLQFSGPLTQVDSAKAAFRQALRQWRCTTGVNFKMGADTFPSVVENDFVNMVRWDDGTDSLPSGVPALTRIFFVACNDVSEVGYIVTGIDISFNDGLPWNFDTTANVPAKVDFYSVAIHEIGHAHCLRHVVENDEVMDYDIALGERRAALSPQAIAGGTWVMDSSTVPKGACYQPMVAVASGDCQMLPVNPPSEVLEGMVVFPNPTNGILHVRRSVRHRGDAEISVLDAGGTFVSPVIQSLGGEGGNEWLVDLNGFPDGLYLLRIRMGNLSSCQKIMLLR